MKKKYVNTIIIIAFILTLVILTLAAVLVSRKIEPFEIPIIEPVWAYWEKKPGEEIPAIVERCYKNWNTIGNIKDIRYLTPENLNMYIPPREISRIERSCDGDLAVKSDFIGLYIIANYGGTVIDGTVYMHQPLSSWLPDVIGAAPFFCFDATRYGSICPETFFMYGKKGSQVASRWYELGLKVGASGKKGREKFISKMNKEFPGKLDKFPKDNYLWMYMVGKYMLLRYPALGDQLNIYTSEDDPLRTIAEANWETDPTCKALTSKQSTRITKLDNGLWKKCPIEIVPV
jgi:hypothetical protein